MSSDRWTDLDDVSVGDGRATGARNVTNTLGFLDSHFPRFPVMPGVLILGSLGRLAGALLAEQPGGAWTLRSASRVGFRHFVRPGDRLELTVELVGLQGGRATLKGDATVGGTLVVRARQLTMERTSPKQPEGR